MQETIIVLYDKDELTVQANEIIKDGVLLVEKSGKNKRLILKKEIQNRNFIRLKIKLDAGKYQIKILGSTSKLLKRITVK